MAKKKHGNNILKKLEKILQADSPKTVILLFSVLLAVFFVNTLFISTSNSLLDNKIEEIKELNRPVKIDISVIECEGCYDASEIVNSIKKQNVDVQTERFFDYGSEEAKMLIEKYNIEKLPSVIISGEINNNKVTFNNFKLTGNALVLDKTNAPYFDVASNKVRGEVELIEIVDSSCDKCVSLSSIPFSLAEAGVSIKDWKKHEYNSAEGREFVKKFGIKKVPSILISKEINYYDEIREKLIEIGLSDKEGYYLLESSAAPYKDLATNKIVGLAELIMLEDASCDECYDVSLNKKILKGLGVAIEKEEKHDISSAEGKKLVSKYNIKKAPIIILSPEAKAYDSFVNAWKQVGSVESDGWFVMRNPEALGTVKDLNSGKIIRR